MSTTCALGTIVPPAKLRVELGGADVLRVDLQHVALGPFHADADRLHELDQHLHVADARHVLQRYRMLSEQRRRNNLACTLPPTTDNMPARRACCDQSRSSRSVQ